MKKKTYRHKKLDWVAEQHPTHPNLYKIYKDSTRKISYTLRSSLEIEGSEDWLQYKSMPINPNAYKASGSSMPKEKDFTVLTYTHKDDLYSQYFGNSHPRAYVALSHFDNVVDYPPAGFKDRTILQVRRESDGETFSLGDYIVDNTTAFKPSMKISEIIIDKDGVLYVAVEGLISRFCLGDISNRNTDKEQTTPTETKEPKRELEKEAHEYIGFNEIAEVKQELKEKAKKNGHTFEEEWEVEYNKVLIPTQTVRTIIGGEVLGCVSYTPLHDFKKDLIQHYLVLMKDYDKYKDNIPPNNKEKEPTEELLADMENKKDSAWNTLEKIENLLADWKKNK